MKTLHKEHSLVQYQTGTVANNQPQPAYFDSFVFQNEWEKLGGDNQFTIYAENYIDLNGLEIDDKSIFFDAITVQSPLPPIIAPKTSQFPNPPAGATIVIYDIIATVPLVIDTYENVSQDIFNGIGYKGSKYDWEHIVYFRTQSWSTDVDFAGNVANLTHQSQSGSGMPTASDRLYCYRFVTWSHQVEHALVLISPARYVLAVTPKKEHDVEYIYRLKRSYELQQTFDRD